VAYSQRSAVADVRIHALISATNGRDTGLAMFFSVPSGLQSLPSAGVRPSVPGLSQVLWVLCRRFPLRDHAAPTCWGQFGHGDARGAVPLHAVWQLHVFASSGGVKVRRGIAQVSCSGGRKSAPVCVRHAARAAAYTSFWHSPALVPDTAPAPAGVPLHGGFLPFLRGGELASRRRHYL
jgi:hypothetical protein